MGEWVASVGVGAMMWAQVPGSGVAGMQVRVAGMQVWIAELHVWVAGLRGGGGL